MLRTVGFTARAARLCVLGVATLATAYIATIDTADARRHRRHVARYSPAYASIIVDANSGATLQSESPDALRHPASLTKIMTLYLLFEQLETGKLKLDSEMDVSAHASRQSPTKLGLRPGQSLRVEDAIKGLVTRSANDAAVVIAEEIGGDEDDFAKLMTRKARALGMTRTVYQNASGLPDSDQVTTARDQAILGRAIQDRFPRYYRYFATNTFVFRGRAIRNHNRLLGSVEGVDGIKTGYTRASGFNLVSSIRRGNRHLVGVVLGGRSGGSRDQAMRRLLADNIEKGATRRMVAAITERDMPEANAAVAETQAKTRPTKMVQVDGAVRVASAGDDVVIAPARPTAVTRGPAPLTNGVIESQAMAAMPGSTEPMQPLRVRTVQVKSGQIKVATAGPVTPLPMTPQPINHGTGNGVLGTLPASSVAAVAPARDAATGIQVNGAIKPAAIHAGWIIQVGALETEGEARQRLDAARSQAKGMLGKADPFTEAVAKGDKTLFRARFAGLDRDKAEAVCKMLKRSDISCITVKN